MNKTKVELVSLIVAILVIATFGTSPYWLPQKTTLLISTSSNSVESGSTSTFSATVMSGKTSVGKGTITWSASAGSFDKTTGTTVLFTAPAVSSNVSVTLVASFAGGGVYQPSAATVQVYIYPQGPLTTTLTVSPKVFQLHGGDSLTLNASLNPSDAPSQLITWSISPTGLGSLNSTTGTTVLYTTPTVQANTTVTISASFSGNEQYTAGSDSSQGGIIFSGPPQKASSALAVSPSTFSVGPNGTQVLGATLTGVNGTILTGVTITWSISPTGLGSLNSTTGTTVLYTAPTVKANTTVTISASFSGNEQYTASSDSSQGGIVAPQPKLTTLDILPFYFSIKSNMTQTLISYLRDANGTILTGVTITWSISPTGLGSLNSTTGTTVLYTAPGSGNATMVTIIASFAGDEDYLGSSTIAEGNLNLCGCA